MQREYRLPAESDERAEWSQWKSCDRVTTRVWKKDGMWHAEGLYGDGIRPALSCATVPK
jgi:hypothetical protein